MADPERSPLLRAEDDENAPRRANAHANDDDVPESPLAENAPLLSGSDTPLYDGAQRDDDAASIRSRRSNKRSLSRRRWPSIIAMIILGLLSLAIIALAFIVPDAVEEYAKEAAVLEPTNLSLESITTQGVRARIQANFKLDGSKVRNDHVRRVGSVATWFVRELGTEATKVNVYLPEYDNVLLGSAGVPPLTIKINGQNTAIDFVADLAPGDAESIRAIANEWLEGRLGSLRFQGKADITLKTGIIPLGTHSISESLIVEASKLPGLPQYNISKVLFRDIDNQTVGAEVSINAFNKYPLEVVIPPLAFDILVPACDPHDPYITVAEANADPVDIRPSSLVVANVHGVVRGLPDSLTRVCPNSKSSPLDHILKAYLGGKAPEVFVRGKERPGMGTPEWLDQIMSQVIVPVPFPSSSLDRLIRNFTLSDARFTLPDPMAEPEDPAATPKVSGKIQVIAGLPKEMNFGINVTHIRAAADVFYHKKQLGVLDVMKWQHANSTRIVSHSDDGPELKIQSAIKDAPLNVTDGDVLTSVIQELIFLGKTVSLDIKAKVDVKVETVLGELVLKDVPAEGRIPVKPFHHGGFEGGNPLARLAPKIGNIMILDSTPDSLRLQALVDITNPTPYSAYVPYVNVHILCNGSTIGEVSAEKLDIATGNNTNLIVTARWQPSISGDKGREIGRDLMSQYISGYNTTLSVRAHRDSIPGQPILGEALSHFNFSIPAPRMQLPGDDDGESDPSKKGHFIRDATFHLLSSSATFTLASPLKYNIVYIEHIDATALYNHTEPIGQILYDLPIAAKPGLSQTPKLPVDWSLGSVGYDKIREALGGMLKLDATATVKVRIGQWRETIWYVGKGIGANVRL